MQCRKWCSATHTQTFFSWCAVRVIHVSESVLYYNHWICLSVVLRGALAFNMQMVFPDIWSSWQIIPVASPVFSHLTLMSDISYCYFRWTSSTVYLPACGCVQSLATPIAAVPIATVTSSNTAERAISGLHTILRFPAVRSSRAQQSRSCSRFFVRLSGWWARRWFFCMHVFVYVCLCVCVCVRERMREIERETSCIRTRWPICSRASAESKIIERDLRSKEKERQKAKQEETET